MIITCDPAKRLKTLGERKLDFLDADLVFADWNFTFEDIRADYGELRFITLGFLGGRMVVVGWTPRGANRHVFTMRKANDRETRKYAPFFPQTRE
jgi:uncharacterized DUF497 family protein